MSSELPATHPVQFDWCHDAAATDAILGILLAYDDPAYISHSELQYGVAEAIGRWAPDRATKARHYVADLLSDSSGNETMVATAIQDGTIVGFALIEISRLNPERPFATIHDVLFSPAVRGHGLGGALFDWLTEQCRACGVKRFFLESGVDNHRAHSFFQRHGFQQTSIVMMRDL
ncbi:MAG: GNAT family N-acetyltransferase [Pseudomonadota bacterium]